MVSSFPPSMRCQDDQLEPASGSAHLGRVPVRRLYRCRDAPDSLDLGDPDPLNAPFRFDRGAAPACAITRASATLEQSLLLVSRRDVSAPGCRQTGEPASA